MADFLPAYRKMKPRERGYVKHSSDRGGETWNGIARNVWPNWTGWIQIDIDMKAHGTITLATKEKLHDLELQFFRTMFWDSMRGDDLPDQNLAELLFDTNVNQGGGSVYLQKALNGLNRGGIDYADIEVDGAVGPMTLAALDAFLERRKNTVLSIGGDPVRIGGVWILMGAIAMQKYERWASLVRRDESQEDFANGWAVRGLQEIVDILHNAGAFK